MQKPRHSMRQHCDGDTQLMFTLFIDLVVFAVVVGFGTTLATVRYLRTR